MVEETYGGDGGSEPVRVTEERGESSMIESGVYRQVFLSLLSYFVVLHTPNKIFSS